MDESRQLFSDLYDQHIEKIYRFIYLKVDSEEVAEDLASEAFVRLWKTLIKEEKEEIENTQAFIYGIARNLVADHYRQNGKIKIVSVEQTIEIEDMTSSVEDQAVMSLEMENVRKALARLKDDYQDYIIWRYLDELSVSEISQITGKSKESVRVGVHRALQALKNECSEEVLTVK